LHDLEVAMQQDVEVLGHLALLEHGFTGLQAHGLGDLQHRVEIVFGNGPKEIEILEQRAWKGTHLRVGQGSGGSFYHRQPSDLCGFSGMRQAKRTVASRARRVNPKNRYRSLLWHKEALACMR